MEEDIGKGRDFRENMPEAQAIKREMNKWDYI